MMLSYQQPAMQNQEDLAALFARNMVLSPDLAAQYQAQQQQQQRQQQLAHRPEPIQTQVANTQPITSQAPPNTAPITYSISQHYHHSTHIVRPQPQQPQQEQDHQQNPFQRRSSEPPQSEQESCESILRSHGVNPAALNPSQAQLFRIAGPEQKARLVELWSICPPATREENPALAWTSTTMEQEEQLAQLRYERQQQLQVEQQQLEMQMNYGNFQAADGRWPGADDHAEPYMQSGYDELMRREAEKEQQRLSGGAPGYSRATDPVYKEAMPSWPWDGRQAGTADAMDVL